MNSEQLYADAILTIYDDTTMPNDDIKHIKAIWPDLIILIRYANYSRDQMIHMLKPYFSNIFIALFTVLNKVSNLLDIMLLVENKLNNVMQLDVISAKKNNVITDTEIIKLYKSKYNAHGNVNITHTVSESLIGGWILIDEKGNVIDRSFKFLNFI